MAEALDEITGKVREYYRRTLSVHGATHRGVDWSSSESQALRFAQLLKIRDSEGECSIHDVGCGYGALAQYLADGHIRCQYRGYDWCPEMIEEARRVVPASPSRVFSSDRLELPADYTVASGIFNVRLDTGDKIWRAYMEDTVDRMFALSRRGFAFNALTPSPVRRRERPDLYLADPHAWFDYCRRLSPRVALLHDYPLDEFTILVRRD